MTKTSEITDRGVTALHRRRQRGAALILTVIVIMVLTTLGIAMVTFTTTEERTASTYRDSLQARSTAEAGVRIVQEMFRTPGNRNLLPLYSASASADDTTSPIDWDYWGADEGATETQLNEIGIWRTARAGANPARYTGPSNRFFAGPFNSSWANVFGGTYSPSSDQYDLKFNCRNPANGNLITNWATTCWLETRLNAMLDNSSSNLNLQTGRITDISIYGPPEVDGEAYGIATVRVTAEKRDSWPDGNLLSRETLVAVIGDATPRPAIFGDGDVNILGQNSDEGCGDGCMNIHANGDVSYSGTISGGEVPMVTATGDAPGTDGDGASSLTAPEINPWDLAYKPTLTAELQVYYLAAARQLDAAWTDGNPSTPADKSGTPCGNDNLSTCQDYNLEFADDGTQKAVRSSAGTAYLYRWNITNSEWDLCSSGTTSLAAGTCAGAPTFQVDRANDELIGTVTDDADFPFATNRVARTEFQISNAPNGQIVLVDGMFRKQGNDDGQISVIAAGTISNQSNSDWWPAASSKILFISGRDIDIQSNCCVPDNNPCTSSVADIEEWSAIWAAHEQIFSQSNTATTGVIVAENHVNDDDTVDSSTQAIDLDKASHRYLCGMPDWPWALPTTPVIVSLTTAAD
jgi:hypothetical protein